MKIKVPTYQGTLDLDVMFGCDAEFFVKDSSGRPVEGSRVVPGTKDSPFKLNNGVCHPDGLSVEVGCPPAETPEGMIVNLFAVMQEVYENYMKPRGYSFINECTVEVKDYPNASTKDLERGCSFEYSAYSFSRKKKFIDDESDKYRHSGFHIHLGFTEHEDTLPVRMDMAALSRAIDKQVLSRSLGTTHQRANQYGGYGAFRVKPYGIEYRALDCRVITDPTKLESMIAMLNDIENIFTLATTVAMNHRHDTGLNESCV